MLDPPDAKKQLWPEYEREPDTTIVLALPELNSVIVPLVPTAGKYTPTTLTTASGGGTVAVTVDVAITVDDAVTATVEVTVEVVTVVRVRPASAKLA